MPPEELSEIYTPGTKKDDLRYCVNVVNDDNSAIEKLEMLYSLGDIASDNEISASYISLRNKKTLNDYKFGVSVEALTKDISNAYKRNQYSGTYKNMSDFIRQIQANSDTFSEYRATIPSIIKRELELSDEEYTKLFKMLSENRNLSRIYTNGTNPHTGKQVYINKEFNINGKVLKGEDILKAIRKACDEILDKTIVDDIAFGRQQIALSFPYIIRHMVTADSQRQCIFGQPEKRQDIVFIVLINRREHQHKSRNIRSR